MKTLRIIFTPPLAFSLIVLLFLIVYVADLRATAMDPDFVEKELIETVYPAVEPELKEELGDLISEGLTEQMGEEEAQIVADSIKDSITDEWVENTTHNFVSGVYDYLNSDSSTLNLTVPLSAEFKDGLKESLGAYFTAEATGLSQEEVDAELEALNQQVDDLPGELTLTFENLNLSVLQNGVAIFGHLFAILIALAVLLAVLLLLLHFKVKDAARVIGFCLFIGGAVSYVVFIVTIRILDGRADSIDTTDWSLSIDWDMVMTLVRDFLHPASIYSIVLMAVGVALIVFSFLWRYIVRWFEARRRPELPCTRLPDQSLPEDMNNL